MSYSENSFPTEFANKVGHLRLIEDPLIQSMIESFETVDAPNLYTMPAPDGKVDLDQDCSIDQVVVVDGGHQPVPNSIRPERQIGFAQVAALLVKNETLQFLRDNPMTDPRETRKLLREFSHHIHAAVPLAGMFWEGQSVRSTIRNIIHRFLLKYELYEALSFLVHREWQVEMTEQPHMQCLNCGEGIFIPRYERYFDCRFCGERHTLADYLGLTSHESEERPRIEVVSNFRAVLEVLTLFSIIIKFRNHPSVMKKTLFLLDGPLLLRAQLSRLIEPIRDLIQTHKEKSMPLYLAGVEKSGEVRGFADYYSNKLGHIGEYFIPSTQYLLEEIQGRAYVPESYRNRVSYGSRAIVRIGPDHVIVLNVPTGHFKLDPKPDDLIGFDETIITLTKLASYSYENALIPIVLANSEASISTEPSGGILNQFVNKMLGDQ